MATIREVFLKGYDARTRENDILILGTAGSYGVERLHVNAGAGWEALEIIATFVTPTGSTAVAVNSDGLVDVPPEATANPCTNGAKIVFAGVSDGVQRISVNLPYIVMDHAPIEGDASTATPSLWAQYVTQAAQEADRAEAAAKSAETYAAQAGESAGSTQRLVDSFAQTVTTAAQGINNAGTKQVENVNKAGQDAVDAANAAGTQAVSNVETAQAAALGAVEAAAEEIAAERDTLADVDACVIVCHAEGETISVSDSAKSRLRGLQLYGKTTQDGTPTPEAPVELVSADNPTVSVCGKNLFDIEAAVNECLVKNTDGTFTINKNATDRFSKYVDVDIPPNTPITIRCFGIGGDGYKELFFRFMMIDGTAKGTTFSPETDTRTISLAARANKVQVYLPPEAAVGDYKTFSHIQVELSENATEYEPYKEVQTTTIPYTLHGIPVASGGNYTDADGQAWICDEVDLARGVYVQRIYQKVFDGTEVLSNNWYPSVVFNLDSKNYVEYNTKVLCNYFATADIGNIYGTTLKFDNVDAYGFESADDVETFMLEKYTAGNPVKICSILQTPIETPLAAEEIAAYKALRTNYLTTNVLNDAGAYMTADYLADLKTYIDNKFNP